MPTKRKTHKIFVTVTTKPGVSSRQAVKEIRDSLKGHEDTFYFENTDLRVKAVRDLTGQLRAIEKGR